MADVITGNTELSATKQDLVAAMVQTTLREQAVVQARVMDVSRFAVPGAQSIKFPFRSSRFSVQKRSSSQKGSAQAIVYGGDKLDLDQNAYISWIIERFDDIQSQIAAEEDALSEAAAEHALQVDSDVVDAMVAGAAAANDVTFATAIDRDDILDMRLKLREQNVPIQRPEDLTLLLAPQEERDMLDIADFTSADRFGSNQPIQNGQIGRVFGMPVLVSTEISSNVSLLFHREALALGFQARPSFDEQKAVEYGAGSMRQALDQLYGWKVLQSGKFISKLAA